MRSLGSLLKKKFSQNTGQSKPSIDEKTIFFIFRKVIQKEFGALGWEKFLPHHFSNKTIFVKSSSPAWSAELWMNEKRILTKISGW
jgi:hypothetical protein